MPTCPHDGFHSGEGRYEPKTAILRYVVVCEACRQELREVSVQRYTPQYIADGSAQQIAA
jgi:hydrogenase maturation factor HypF (carbamoyltransferase family)